MKPFIHTYTHTVEPRGHCATICPHQKGVLIGYYNGPECSDKQAVNLEYWEQGERKCYAKLQEKTGNCVLWAINENEAGLIFSLFEDTDGVNQPECPVQRWMFCSNWQVKMTVKTDIIEGSDFSRLPLIVGHLVRCQPIQVNKSWYLPMYREHNCKGVIMRSIDGWKWMFAGKIGDDMKEMSSRFGNGVLIQPTIWHDGEKFHSLSRDVTGARRAWYSASKTGLNWTKPQTINLWNDNNSVVIIHDGTATPWLVWNHGASRKLLTLGKWDPQLKTAKPILKLNKGFQGSYPNYCIDYDRNIQIVHTDGLVITRHVLSPEMLLKLEELTELTELEDIKEWEYVTK